MKNCKESEITKTEMMGKTRLRKDLRVNRFGRV